MEMEALAITPFGSVSLAFEPSATKPSLTMDVSDGEFALESGWPGFIANLTPNAGANVFMNGRDEKSRLIRSH